MANVIVKALSIRQPWAWAIVQGYKGIENRDWSTRYRGSMLIHAAKTFGREEREACEWIEEHFGIALPREFARGGIVGRAELVDCVTEHESPWFFGDYGFVLQDCRPLEFYPLCGKLGLFDVVAPDVIDPHGGWWRDGKLVG